MDNRFNPEDFIDSYAGHGTSLESIPTSVDIEAAAKSKQVLLNGWSILRMGWSPRGLLENSLDSIPDLCRETMSSESARSTDSLFPDLLLPQIEIHDEVFGCPSGDSNLDSDRNPPRCQFTPFSDKQITPTAFLLDTSDEHKQQGDNRATTAAFQQSGQVSSLLEAAKKAAIQLSTLLSLLSWYRQHFRPQYRTIS